MRLKHGAIIAAVAAVLLVGALGARQFIRPLWPAIGPAAPTGSPADSGQPTASGPLTAADGWVSSLLTDKVSGARDLAVDHEGNIWVSRTSEGTVSLIYMKDGAATEVTTPLRGLRKPHGLVFDPENRTHLYVATETSILRVLTYSDAKPEKIADLPGGGRHFTRSLAFGRDGRLYVSIGSTCDVCREKNPEIAAVISMNKDGSDRRITATGLRNAVFLTAHPKTGDIWGTEMGRDNLGDNLPPDEINLLQAGADYGWPLCYGEGVHDADFDKNVYIRDPCADTVHPVIDLPAHVAPLGLAFLPDGDLLVGYHGSWNSSVPVGYKVARWHKGAGGRWTSSDFLTGFIRGAAAIGRPVDVLPMADGSVLVSDDKSGSIWKVSRSR